MFILYIEVKIWVETVIGLSKNKLHFPNEFTENEKNNMFFFVQLDLRA